jgi:hypothetical protein
VLTLVLLLSPLWATTARAYEDRAALGVEAGYGVRALAPEHAVAFGVDAGFGLGDTWELRVDAAYLFHPETLHRVRGAVEVLYVVDILTVVPYVGIGTGILVTVQPTDVRPDWEAHVVAGFDVFVDRAIVLGLAVRPVFVPTWADIDLFHVTVTARFAVLVEL